MNTTFECRVQDRRLSLMADGAHRLALPLDQGGRHHLLVADADTAQRVVSALERCPGVGVLPAGGGLLGANTLAENFALALRYDADAEDRRDWDQDLDIALRLCGLTPERIAALGRERPMALERTERWTLGFARWLLRPPELLVIDRMFAGLARRQAEALIAVEAVYHRRHPFRPVLFVDLDSHELPLMPDCRTAVNLADLAETSCPS